MKPERIRQMALEVQEMEFELISAGTKAVNDQKLHDELCRLKLTVDGLRTTLWCSITQSDVESRDDAHEVETVVRMNRVVQMLRQLRGNRTFLRDAKLA